MKSPVETIYRDETLSAENKADQIYALYKKLVDKIAQIYYTLYDEDTKLNALMNANGLDSDNDKEHHAKTMVYYGRKLAIKDSFFGTTSPHLVPNPVPEYASDDTKKVNDDPKADSVHNEPHVLSNLPGLQQILNNDNVFPTNPAQAQFCGDYGRITVSWRCRGNDLDENLYRPGYEPAVGDESTKLVQYHMLGSEVSMPNIVDLDNDGKTGGHNEYRLIAGVDIQGWEIDKSVGIGDKKVYLYDDSRNDYLYLRTKKSNGEMQLDKIEDTRTFAMPLTVAQSPDGIAVSAGKYLLPFNYNVLPNKPANLFTGSIQFKPKYIHYWFKVEFVVSPLHLLSAPDTAPYKMPITTRMGDTITLPATTEITLKPGFSIDTSLSPYGSWTTVNPQTGVVDYEPKPNQDIKLPDDPPYVYNALSSYIVGVTGGNSQFYPGIRKLYLKVVQNVTP